MADAAFITPSAEMLPIKSGTPVVAASTASGGIFAGMLAQRFQPSVKGETVDTAVRPTLPAGNPPPGQSSPQGGNTLPANATARPDVPLQDLLTQVRDVPDTSAVLPVGVIPPLAPLPDAKLQPLSEDRPVSADERYSQPGRVPSPVALSLAGLMGAQSEARLARPASLGLNVRGETAEMLRIAIAPLSAEQTARGGMVAQLTNQALSGDSLSRPFQQQIDHLLAMSRSPVISAGPGMTLLAPSDTAASIIPADLSPTAFLPGGGSDVRAGALTGPGSLSGLPVNTPMGQPGWSAELGQRMVWLANREIREAQIQLNPRHLGPIDVRIIYSDTQQLSVSFTAQNPAAREALDAALPRLREMFEQQGLSLADASVSQESFAGQQQEAENENGLRHDAAVDTHWVDNGDEEPQQQSPPVPIGLGLVDIFA